MRRRSRRRKRRPQMPCGPRKRRRCPLGRWRPCNASGWPGMLPSGSWPRPGAGFGGEPAQTVIPDVHVRPDPAGGWKVELNTDTLPRLLVDKRYHAVVSTKARSDTEKAFVADCAAQAGVSVVAALLGGMQACSAPRPRQAPARCAAEADGVCCSDDMAGQAAKAWA